MKFQYRSVLTVILLSIFTFGIYSIYYTYSLQEAMKNEFPEEKITSGAMVILLIVVTLGIYAIYWMYVTSKRLDYIVQREMHVYSEDTLLFMLIGILFTPVAFEALTQNKVNEILFERNKE